MVRCLCGAANCSGFLGAKSRGFQVGEVSRLCCLCVFEPKISIYLFHD